MEQEQGSSDGKLCLFYCARCFMLSSAGHSTHILLTLVEMRLKRVSSSATKTSTVQVFPAPGAYRISQALLAPGATIWALATTAQ